MPILSDVLEGSGRGGGRTASSVKREFDVPLVRAGVALICDGLFLELHPDPDRAPSDGQTMPPHALPPVLTGVTATACSLAPKLP